MSIPIVKTLQELDPDLNWCPEEPGGFYWGVGGELLGSEAKADVFDPCEKWAVLTPPAMFFFTRFFSFSIDA